MDFQRIIAFIVFSLSILLLWEAWQKHNLPAELQVSMPAGTVSGESTIPKPTETLPDEVGERVAEAPSVKKGDRVVVKTDLLTATIDAHGGDIRNLVLTHYRKDVDRTQPFVLFEEQAGRNYFAQSGLIGEALPSHKAVFQLQPGEITLAAGENQLRIPLRWVGQGVEVIKTYTFTRGSYVIDVETEVRNEGAAALSGQPYYQIFRHGQAPEGQSAFMYTFTGPAMYTDAGKFQKIEFSQIESGKQDHVKSASDGWMAMVQHHFLSAWLTRDGSDTSRREFFSRALGDNQYAAGLIMSPLTLAPGASWKGGMRLYAGPQEQENLKALAPGLEHVVDYGIFTIFAYPLFVLLNWLENLVGNWGYAIILLTVLIKLAFYPLSAASYKSMAQMRKLGPRLQHLKERYGDDRQKMHEQMMKIYKEEQINPLGGCLPILVQIPVFIALYWVLLGAVELRQAPFALWIHDLSEADPYYVLPVLMAVSMFVQQKLSPTPPDPVQAKIMMFMPLVFSVFFFFFPAGLVLYWLVNNLLSILQQWRINHVIEHAGHGKGKSK